MLKPVTLLVFALSLSAQAAPLTIAGPTRLVDYGEFQEKLQVTIPVKGGFGAVKLALGKHDPKILKAESRNLGRQLVLTFRLANRRALDLLSGLRIQAKDARGGVANYVFPGVQQRIPQPPRKAPQPIAARPTDPATLDRLAENFRATGRLAYGQAILRFYPEHARLFSDPITLVRGLDAAYRILVANVGYEPHGGQPMEFLEMCPFVPENATPEQRAAIYDTYKAKDPVSGAYLRADCPNGSMVIESYAYAGWPLALREGTVELARSANDQNTLHLILLHEMGHNFDEVADAGGRGVHLFSGPTVEAWADLKVVSLLDPLRAATGLGIRQWERNFFSEAELSAVYKTWAADAYNERAWTFEEIHSLAGHGRFGNGRWKGNEVYTGTLLTVAETFGQSARNIVRSLATINAYPRQTLADATYGLAKRYSRYDLDPEGNPADRATLFHVFDYVLSVTTGKDYAGELARRYRYPLLGAMQPALGRGNLKQGLYEVLTAAGLSFYRE